MEYFISEIKSDLVFYQNKFYSIKNKKVSVYSCIKFLFVPCYAVVFWFRVYSRLAKRKNRFLRKVGFFLYFRASQKYSSDIHPDANIGIPFKVGHHFGVVIGPDVRIGNGVYLFNDVTLGNKNVGLEDVMPSLGDNIIVGAGSRLLGGINVASNAIIGANSIVLKDVGEGEVWAGSPAKFVKHNEMSKVDSQ